MITREAVLTYIKEQYGAVPDYPWQKYPNFAVLRHADNQKWFALMMDITADKLGMESDEIIDVINLKVEKELIGALRKKKGVYPAYHMNKATWVTVHLEEIESAETLKELIADSYELTK